MDQQLCTVKFLDSAAALTGSGVARWVCECVSERPDAQLSIDSRELRASSCKPRTGSQQSTVDSLVPAVVITFNTFAAPRLG